MDAESLQRPLVAANRAAIARNSRCSRLPIEREPVAARALRRPGMVAADRDGGTSRVYLATGPKRSPGELSGEASAGGLCRSRQPSPVLPWRLSGAWSQMSIGERENSNFRGPRAGRPTSRP